MSQVGVIRALGSKKPSSMKKIEFLKLRSSNG